MGPLAY